MAGCPDTIECPLTPEEKISLVKQCSAKIHRNTEKMFILLIGVSGVGKSSLVNHLFNLGQENKIEYSSVSSDSSCTKMTKEFCLTHDSEYFETPNLKLSIIDTPGYFEDGEGYEQNACNFVSVKKFIKTHPELKGCYPNLIFLCFRASDNRFNEECSQFVKLLKSLEPLKVVDKAKINLIIIVESANDIFKGMSKDEALMVMDLKSSQIKSLANKYLKIKTGQVDVVFIENKYERLERPVIPKDSSCTKRLLKYVSECKNKYWTQNEELTDPDESQFDENSASTLDQYDLESNQRENEGNPENELSDFTLLPTGELQPLNLFLICIDLMHNNGDLFGEICFNSFFMESANASLTESLCVPANLVTTGHELTEEEEIVYTCLINLGKRSKCQNAFEEYYRAEKKLNIDDEVVNDLTPENNEGEESSDLLNVLPDSVVQQRLSKIMACGYHLFTDQLLLEPIIDLNQRNDENTIFQFEIVDLEKKYRFQFESKEMLFQKRLRELRMRDLPVSLNLSLFTERRPGFNLESDEIKLFFEEYRRIEIIFRLNSNSPFSQSFMEAVKNLPRKCCRNFERVKEEYVALFNRFGHYIVISAFAGGSIEINLQGERYVDFTGGKTEFNHKDTYNDPLKMKQWKNSILTKPVFLTTEMSLEPISTVVSFIDKEKGSQVKKAFKTLFMEKDKAKSNYSEEQYTRRGAGESAGAWFKEYCLELVKVILETGKFVFEIVKYFK